MGWLALVVVLVAGVACGETTPAPGDDAAPDAVDVGCDNGAIDPGELCLAESTDFLTPDRGVELKAADLDGDGDVDLVAIHEGGSAACIHENLGDGSFGECAGLAPLPGGVRRVVIGDIDKDGRLDLVVAEETFGDAYVFWGLGNLRFELGVQINDPAVSIAVPRAFIAIGLVDDDLEPDVIHHGTDDLHAALSDGARGFLHQPALPLPFNFGSLGDAIIADFTDDGLNDVIIGARDGLAVGDFNDDGFPDVASAGEVALIVRDEDGLFLPNVAEFDRGVLLSSPTSGDWVIADDYDFGTAGPVVADFNRDGFEDIASIDHDSSSLRLLLGDADGLFTASPAIQLDPTGRFPTDLVAGDFNSDMVPDIAVLNEGTSNIVIMMSNP